jgi:hypothetical protein
MTFNSWHAYLRSKNESDAVNHNFDALVDALGAAKLSNDMTNAITEDHDSVILAVESKRVKFIHSCKNSEEQGPSPISPSHPSPVKEQRRSRS